MGICFKTVKSMNYIMRISIIVEIVFKDRQTNTCNKSKFLTFLALLRKYEIY